MAALNQWHLGRKKMHKPCYLHWPLHPFPCANLMDNFTVYKHRHMLIILFSKAMERFSLPVSVPKWMIYSGLSSKLIFSKLIHNNKILVHLNINTAAEYLKAGFIKIPTQVITEYVAHMSDMTFLKVN